MGRSAKERDKSYAAGDPVRLGAALSQLFTARGYGRPHAVCQLHAAWQEISGAGLAGRTKVLTLKNGVLHVGVSNSALLSELASFRKQELLEQFHARRPQLRIRDLKFLLRSDSLPAVGDQQPGNLVGDG